MDNTPVPIPLRILLICLLIGILEIAPGSLRGHQALTAAREAQQARRPDEAVQHLRSALAEQPWRTGLWGWIGEQELAAGNPQAAAAAFLQAESAGTLDLGGRRALGEAYQRAGQASLALATWRAILLDGQADPLLLEHLYHLELEQGDPSAALQTLARWAELEPGNGQVRYRQGLLTLLADPDAGLALLLAAGRLDDSLNGQVTVLRKAVGLAGLSDNPAYRQLVIGRALGSVGEWDLAARAFSAAVKIDPQYAEGWAFLGEARQQLGQDGLSELQQAEEANPASLVVQALLSVYYRRQGQTGPALDALQKMAAIEPDASVWQVEIGNTLAESGDLVAALPHFQHAAALEPSNASAWQALALFSLDYGMDIERIGLPAARQAVLLAPGDARMLDLMGRAFFLQGDLVSAERFLQRALEKDAQLASAHLHLGQVYLQGGEYVEAYGPLASAARLGAAKSAGLTARRLLDQYYPAGSASLPLP